MFASPFGRGTCDLEGILKSRFVKSMKATSRFGGGSLEPIPHAPHADDVRGPVGVVFELAPQRRHVGVDGAMGDVHVPAPHGVQDAV
jgi:hypothetical protein